jgi:hypothetical protein
MSDQEIKQVLGLLHQEDTLRVLSAVALGASVEESGLDHERSRRALDRLERAGLVTGDEAGGRRVRRERFRDLLREMTATSPPASLSPEDQVLRAFFVDGRLRTVPSRREKRLTVLNHIARVFEPGVRYAEKEVNVVLRAFHDDHAALRRYLIDENLLTRKDGIYWRSGGPVDL